VLLSLSRSHKRKGMTMDLEQAQNCEDCGDAIDDEAIECDGCRAVLCFSCLASHTCDAYEEADPSDYYPDDYDEDEDPDAYAIRRDKDLDSDLAMGNYD